jgi:hypothetical protein
MRFYIFRTSNSRAVKMGGLWPKEVLVPMRVFVPSRGSASSSWPSRRPARNRGSSGRTRATHDIGPATSARSAASGRLLQVEFGLVGLIRAHLEVQTRFLRIGVLSAEDIGVAFLRRTGGVEEVCLRPRRQARDPDLVIARGHALGARISHEPKATIGLDAPRAAERTTSLSRLGCRRAASLPFEGGHASGDVSIPRSEIPLQSTPAFDESKTSCAVVVNPMGEVNKIEQNDLDAAETARESRTQEVFDGKPESRSFPGCAPASA